MCDPCPRSHSAQPHPALNFTYEIIIYQILFSKSVLWTHIVAAFSKLSNPANPRPPVWLWGWPSPLSWPQSGPFFPAVLTQCDFEDNSNPLCDWTQGSTDDGDWTRASGPSPTGSTGPPGDYPNGGKEA